MGQVKPGYATPHGAETSATSLGHNPVGAAAVLALTSTQQAAGTHVPHRSGTATARERAVGAGPTLQPVQAVAHPRRGLSRVGRGFIPCRGADTKSITAKTGQIPPKPDTVPSLPLFASSASKPETSQRATITPNTGQIRPKPAKSGHGAFFRVLPRLSAGRFPFAFLSRVSRAKRPNPAKTGHAAFRLALAALAISLAAPASAQPSQVLSTTPVPHLSAHPGAPTRVSPDGRFAVFESSGPGSAQHNLHLVDLTDKVKTVTLAYSRAPEFVNGGKALAYWRYDLGGASGLYVLPLFASQGRRIYPLTPQEEGRGAFRGSGTTWNGATGEVLTVRDQEGRGGWVYAIRLKDGAVRRIPVRASEVQVSPRRDRLAGNLTGPAGGSDLSVSRIWTADPAGKRRRDLMAGFLLGWTPEGDLLVQRGGRFDDPGYSSLQRVDPDSGAARYLGEIPAPVWGFNRTCLSPGRGWVAISREDAVELISTQTGGTTRLNLPGADALFWGSERHLYYRKGQNWTRAEIRIGQPGPAPAVPPADRQPVSLSQQVASPWQTPSTVDGPWRVYRGPARVQCMAEIQGETWVGTSNGVQRLQPSRKALPRWARALAGRSVERIDREGDTLTLLTRRTAPFNGPNAWESARVEIDLRSGRVRERFLDPSGFGAQTYLAEQAGASPVTLERPYGSLKVWDDWGHAVLGGRPDNPVSGTAVARSTDGACWIGTENGLLHWKPGEPAGRAWTEKHGLAAGAVLSLAELGGKLWVGTTAGLSLLDLRSGQVSSPTGVGLVPVLQLVRVRDRLFARGAGWLAERDATGAWKRWPLQADRLHTDGRALYAQHGARLRRWTGAGRWIPVPLPTGPVDVAETTADALLWSDGILWCGHPGAVSRFDSRTRTWSRFPLPAPSYQVQSLAVSGESLWVALWRGGLLRLDARTGAVRGRFLKAPGEEKQQGTDSTLVVYQVVADPSGVYAHSSQGFYQVDVEQGRSRLVPNPPRGKLLGRFRDTLWFLDEMRPEGVAQLTELSVPDLTPTVHHSVPVSHWNPLAVEPSGAIWVRRRDLQRVNLEGQVLAAHPVPRRFRDLTIQALTWSPGYLWVALEGQSASVPYQPVLLRLRLSDGQWQELPTCPASGVRQMQVAGGSLWLATWNGLARLPLPPGELPPLPEPDRAGLPPEREIFQALRHGDLAEVRALLDAGLAVDVRAENGETPLMRASGSLDAMRLLLERGADPNAVAPDGGTPLSHAVWKPEAVRLLLEHGAKPDVKHPPTRQPLLLWLLTSRAEESARLLIEAGADVNVAGPRRSLEAALLWGSPDLIQLLLAKGADPNARDADGFPMLVLAAQRKPQVLKGLVDAGAEVDAAGKEGTTALMVVAHRGQLPAARLLLERGADPLARDGKGNTALSLARTGGNAELIRLLEEAAQSKKDNTPNPPKGR